MRVIQLLAALLPWPWTPVVVLDEQSWRELEIVSDVDDPLQDHANYLADWWTGRGTYVENSSEPPRRSNEALPAA